ncbi:MAG: phosphoesterase [Legionellales bacterium]|nr:phosphoesterase [Legionellales bacterium]|tara:strand:+ start:184 stop:441 length:258 start_codon:yes stop_codon:yes gene_type:complete
MADQDDNAHWRDSGRKPTFFIFDISAFYPFMLFLIHIRLWTFLTAAGVIIFLEILRRNGFTPVVFRRFLRNFIAGPLKTATPWWL